MMEGPFDYEDYRATDALLKQAFLPPLALRPGGFFIAPMTLLEGSRP
jgi:hypothetical protein